MCNIPTTLDGKKVPLTVCYGYNLMIALDDDEVEDDPVYIFAAQGQVGMTAVWIWQTLIPADKWAVGTITPPQLDGELNFSTSLLYGNVVGTEIDQVWLEGMALDGSFEVVAEGEICGGGACPKAQFGIDIDLVAIKTELDMSE
jgi:hypothetical protein